MNEVLDMLYQLSNLDSEIFSIKRQMGDLPAKRESLEELIKKRSDERQALLEERSGNTEKNADLEKHIAEYKGKIKEDKDYLTQVKSNEEYMTVLQEIKNRQDFIQESENTIMKNMKRAEEIEKRLAELDTQSMSEDSPESELKAITAELEKDDTKLAELNSQRESLIRHLPDDLAKKYDKLFDRRKGLPIVMIETSYCTGCYSEIPEQLVDNVKSMDKVNYCINCGRILLWKKDENTR